MLPQARRVKASEQKCSSSSSERQEVLKYYKVSSLHDLIRPDLRNCLAFSLHLLACSDPWLQKTPTGSNRGPGRFASAPTPARRPGPSGRTWPWPPPPVLHRCGGTRGRSIRASGDQRWARGEAFWDWCDSYGMRWNEGMTLHCGLLTIYLLLTSHTSVRNTKPL